MRFVFGVCEWLFGQKMEMQLVTVTSREGTKQRGEPMPRPGTEAGVGTFRMQNARERATACNRAVRAAGLIVLLAVSPASGEETVLQRLLGGKIGRSNSHEIENSVVKIYVSASPPDLVSPWQKSGVMSTFGSGVVIDGKCILTNAHVVDHAVSIEVKCSDMSQRYAAQVKYIDHDCDLAVLVVDDESFFASAPPIELGQMPKAQTRIQAYGFPVGGESMCVTSGIISRIELSWYTHSVERLLLAQIDAAINPGNSGGPVLADDQLVGIAVQSWHEAENVGYMIPIAVVQHFLQDIQDGHVDGFPKLGITTQELDSLALRRSLGMSDSQTGSVVTWVDHGSPAHGVLRPRDVLLEIDGKPIANDASVAWPTIGRVNYSQVVRSMQIGETVNVRVLRDGEVFQQSITLSPYQRLVPGRRPSQLPQYLIVGGLVLQPLSGDYLAVFSGIPYDLGNHYHGGNRVTQERRQIIVIQKVLPHPVNQGYQSWEDHVIQTVNGVVPQDMKHLSAIIDGATGPYLEIVTEHDNCVVLDLAAARAAGATILANFSIAHDRSPDLRTGELASAAQ